MPGALDHHTAMVIVRGDLLALLRRAATEIAARRVLINVVIAFLPAAVVGFLAKDFIKNVLFSTATVGVALATERALYLAE